MRKHYNELPLFPNEELAEQELKRNAMASASRGSTVTDAGESPNEVKPNKEIIMAIFEMMEKSMDKAKEAITDNVPPELLPYINDYKLHVVEVPVNA